MPWFEWDGTNWSDELHGKLADFEQAMNTAMEFTVLANDAGRGDTERILSAVMSLSGASMALGIVSRDLMLLGQSLAKDVIRILEPKEG